MPKDPLQLANEALDKAIDTEKRNKAFMSSIGPAIISALSPLFTELKGAISKLKVDVAPVVEINPEFKIPKAEVTVHQEPVDTDGIESVLRNAFDNFKLPTPEVKVTIPKIDMPKMEWPKGDMPIKGDVNLLGINVRNPLPVQLRDADGKPMSFNFDSLNVLGGGGGGRQIARIGGIDMSAWGELLSKDGRLKVESPSGASGLTDTELRASHLDVQQLSGSVDSVNIVSSVTLETLQLSGSISSVKVTGFDTSVGATILNGDGSSLDPRDRNWTITETVPISAAVALDVKQVSGSIDSVNVVTTVGLTNTELRATTVDVKQVSGSIDSVSVTGFVTSVQATIIDSSGVGYSGSNPVPISIASQPTTLDVKQLSGSIDSVSIASQPTTFDVKQLSGSIDSVAISAIGVTLGVDQVSGANWSVTVQGSVSSVVAVGDIPSGTADTGSAPVKGGGIVRTTNPTAEADGDRITSSHDDVGRQVMRPVQVRDLIATAYVSLTGGTETTLLAAGGAGVFHDLIFIEFSNNSTAAVGIDLRGVTAGNIEKHYEIPANSVVGGALPVPWPQGNANNNWTVDLPDISGTTVTISALFSKEV